MSAIDFDTLPLLVWELCEGPCMRRGQTLYALDRPGRARRWYCRSCYFGRWVEAGRPGQVTA